MEYDSQIKYHAKKPHELLSQEPNNAMLARLAIVLSTTILNHHRFKNIDAAPPISNGSIGSPQKPKAIFSSGQMHKKNRDIARGKHMKAYRVIRSNENLVPLSDCDPKPFPKEEDFDTRQEAVDFAIFVRSTWSDIKVYETVSSKVVFEIRDGQISEPG